MEPLKKLKQDMSAPAGYLHNKSLSKGLATSARGLPAPIIFLSRRESALPWWKKPIF